MGGARVELYQVDTHYPGSENRSLAVVLYGELGTSEFSLFHQILKQYAQEGAIDYVVRHYVKVSSHKHYEINVTDTTKV